MLVEDKKIDDSLVVTLLESRLDASIALNFKEKLTEYIKAGNSEIVLNLSAVDFVDSSGLGALVSSLKILGQDGDLSVCGLKEPVMSMFKLTRMDKVFTIFPSEEEALSTVHA